MNNFLILYKIFINYIPDEAHSFKISTTGINSCSFLDSNKLASKGIAPAF